MFGATRWLSVAVVTLVLGCGWSPIASQDSLVCAAIGSGDMNRALQLVRDGADPNAGHGCALTAAAGRAQFDLVNLLLDHGANANRMVTGDVAVMMGGTTPLVAAVQSRDVGMVRLLLERGADPRDDFEAFEIILNFGDVEMAELLLQHGASANMTAAADTPVYYYVSVGPRESRQESVAERDLAPDRIDETVRQLACDISTGRGTSLLHEAFEPRSTEGGDGRARIAMRLIERGANPNSRNLSGTTPLMIAARGGMHGGIRLLKDAGADVNAADRCGRTAADYAGSADTVALLEGS
jgi:uncharacterized protein